MGRIIISLVFGFRDNTPKQRQSKAHSELCNSKSAYKNNDR